MAMKLCASCKQRVEDGSLRCPNCGAKLDLPGAFMQVIGWVISALSLIPFAISMITTGEKDPIPLIIGIVVLALGLSLLFSGKLRTKRAPPTTLEDTSAQGVPPPTS